MGGVVRAQKKPVVVEAWHYPTVPTFYDNAFFHRWVNDGGGHTMATEKGNMIETLEGLLVVSPGDWVIRGVKGEFYPVKPDIFLDTYVIVDEAKVNA